MARLSKTQERALQLILERVQLKGAGLCFSDEQRAAIAGRFGDRMPDDSEEIREAMQCYRQTWIEPLIRALLENDLDKLRKIT